MMTGTTKTITLSLPSEMVERVEELMEKEGRTRSDFFREALGRYFEEKEWREILRYGRMKAKEKGITENQIEDIVDAYRQ